MLRLLMAKSWLIVVIVVLIYSIVPIANIWALNTLFALDIPFTWRTYLAAFILTSYLIDSGGRRKT